MGIPPYFEQSKGGFTFEKLLGIIAPCLKIEHTNTSRYYGIGSLNY